MIEIPSDLHKDLVPLVFLLGNWAGAGVHDFPGSEKCNFGQEVSFTHDGRDFLEYHSHSWVLDDEGNKVRPLESESGYWRIDADRKVEVVMVRQDGVVEVWYGELAAKKPQIDIVTDGRREADPGRRAAPVHVGAAEEGRHPGGRRALGEGPAGRHAGRRDRFLQVDLDSEVW